MTAASAGDATPFRISHASAAGQRPFLATVLFVGAVPPTQGSWWGVEWDDPSRGKHSGEVDGVSFFRCRREGAGSFLRPGAKGISRGRSMMEAIDEQYAPEGDRSWVPRPRIGLDYQRIASAGSGEAGKATVPSSWLSRVNQVDLSYNMFATFEEALLASRPFPSLTTLLLNGNRFAQHWLLPTTTCPALREIHLNRTLLPWSSIAGLLHAAPQLKVLQMASNSLGSTGALLEPLPECQLEELFLDSNVFNDWTNLCLALAELKQRLFLASNALTPHSHATLPPSVTSLNLAANKVVAATSLAALISVRSLWILDNAFGSSASQGRLESLRVLPNLNDIDGTPVTQAERSEARGSVERASPLKEPSTMRSRLIDMRILIAGTTIPAIQLQLLPSMTLRQLRLQAGRKADVALAKGEYRIVFRLGGVAGQREEVEVEASEEARPLSYWGVASGDEVSFLRTAL